jgi:hypothetical protein
LSGSCGRDFGIVVGQRGVLDYDDDIRAVLAQLGRLGSDSRRTKYKRVNFGVEFVCELPRSGHRLEAYFPNIGTTGLDESKDVGH